MLPDSEIEGLYRLGFSCADIAHMDGRSEGTVYNRLLAMNIPRRSRSEANRKFNDRLAVSLYNLGLSCNQIGRLIGVHSTTVFKRLQGLGFPMRTSETAAAVGYSDEEFETHFCASGFLSRLNELS